MTQFTPRCHFRKADSSLSPPWLRHSRIDLARLFRLRLVALAQAGSTGGSVGVGEKTLSGSRSEPFSDREERRPRGGRQDQESGGSSRRGGASAANFDGAWSYIVVGTNCRGSSSGAIMMVAGSARRNRKCQLQRSLPCGRHWWPWPGVDRDRKVIGEYRRGSFRRSDGCVGRWTASKQ
jgi:hypothetical protein